MTTEILSWDEKYFYYQHKFFCAEKLVAIGLVKEVVLKSGETVAPMMLLNADRQINSAVEDDVACQQLHPIVEQWLLTQKQIKYSCET